MTAIKIDLPKELETIEIHTFADLHIGEAHCDMNDIRRRIDTVKNTENAYVILNGDLLNNALKTSLSDVYSEKMAPMDELKTCVELFEPISDRILCITTGNHERRTYNGAGLDMMYLVAKELHVEDRFSSTGAVLFIRFGWNKTRKRKQWYSIYVTHGSGGGKKVGAKAIKLADMESIVDCDIYVHAHTHLPICFKQGFYRTDFINSAVSMVEKLFVNTAAELDYGGYGEIYGYKPASKSTPIIYLCGTEKKFSAKL